MAITKRGLLGAAAGTLLARAARAQGDAQGEMQPHERELYEAAKREGEVTWYSGQYSAEASEAIGRGFSERYPGVRCNVVRSTSQVAFQRLSQDMRAGVAQCDILSSTNSGHLTQLKADGSLTQFRPKNADGMLDFIRVADPDNYFQTTYLGLYLMAHNTRKVPDAEAPKGWADVLAPRWNGQLAMGHPGFSGAIGIWAVQMRKMFGWDYFTKLERNRPQIGRSSEDPVTLLNAGERTVGLCVPSLTTRLNISRGNPLKLIYPVEGTIAAFSPSGIIKNAPHPNAAKLFMEYQAGPHMSRVVAGLFGDPMRPDVPPSEGGKPISEIKLLSPSMEEQEKGIPEVRELWRDTFGV